MGERPQIPEKPPAERNRVKPGIPIVAPLGSTSICARNQAKSSWIGWPVLSGFDRPSFVTRDSKGTPSAWKIVALSSCGRTGLSLAPGQEVPWSYVLPRWRLAS